MVVVDRFRTQGNESRRFSRHLCLELTLGLFWVSLCWDVQRCMVKATGGLPGLCVPISVNEGSCLPTLSLQIPLPSS